ncbi:non-ribosomal peptide synthetase module [Paenibacillus chartarius]|uniref:Non-ribosomal peptide synthetase module n=1 Tax=Paenibacillus chartarius TaxID=747481 RepID=A0ABV6DJ37_9BACL
MAQRLATEYVKTCLQLTEEEFHQFVSMFISEQATLQTKVLENGNQEVVLQDDGGQEIVLPFERVSDLYVCMGSCIITNHKIVNAMRKAVSTFRGSAIVKRIYSGYTMVYQYEEGTVRRIVEVKNGSENVIYEYKDTLGMLEQLFHKREVEQEIESIYKQINGLLDLRNELKGMNLNAHIDERLQQLTRRLFALEA